ncbi:1,4-alpha-glucan branching enzyme, partial [gut metagenome]
MKSKAKISKIEVSSGAVAPREGVSLKKQNNPADLPIYLFKQGNNFEAYRFFGAHFEEQAGEEGVVFRTWAPHAKEVSVVGE